MTSNASRSWIARIVIAAGLAGLPGLAIAQYKIQRGDVLEVLVAGLPELKQKVVVGVDGEIATAMVESIKVAGMSVADAQKHVKARMSQRLYHQRTFDGKESASAITPDSVSLTIVEYRPIYIDGDVSKPGDQVFRPGMTVRQAIALAGGYEIMRFRANNPFLESADLRSEYQSLWLEYVRKQSAIWRMKAELEGGVIQTSLEEVTKAPLAESELERTREMARQELATRLERNRAEVAHLERAVKTTQAQVDILTSRQQTDDKNAGADADDYERLRAFAQKGSLSNARLSDSRRLYLFSATQALQTSTQLAESMRQNQLAERELERFKETRRLDVLKELDEATLELETTRAKLAAVSEKIAYTGILRSQLVRGSAGATLRISRKSERGAEQLAASEDTELQPGDTVEVALRIEAPDRASGQ